MKTKVKLYIGLSIILAIIVIIGISIYDMSKESNTFTDFGDDFDQQTLTVNFNKQPQNNVTITFDARISKINNYGIDNFATGVYVNGIGGFSQTLQTWDYVLIRGTDFKTYTCVLPVDINNDGINDWKSGNNEVTIYTLSSYNVNYGSTEVSQLEFTRY